MILPDSESSARWETADRKYLEAAFKAAGVQYDIQNAQDDKTAFQTIADQMITSGVTVLMIVNLDSGTGKAVLDKAKAQGVGAIDYDRLTLSGGASYYVSFDNVAVGKLQGEGLVKCLTDEGVSEAGRRRAERLADRQQRHAVQEGLRLGAQAEVRLRRVHQGPGPVGAGVGQHPGRHDLRADADPDRATRSTACSPPTTAWATRPSRCSRATGSTARSRSPARTPPCRACRTSSPATSA